MKKPLRKMVTFRFDPALWVRMNAHIAAIAENDRPTRTAFIERAVAALLDKEPNP